MTVSGSGTASLRKKDDCPFEECTEIDVITAVCTATADPLYFNARQFQRVLVIATPTYVKFVPLAGASIDLSQFYVTEVKFTPLSLLGLQFGQVIAGGDDGNIYLFQFRDTTYECVCRSRRKWPFDIWFGLLPWLLATVVGFAAPGIVKLSYCCDSGILAGITETGRVHFFSTQAWMRQGITFIGETPSTYDIVAVAPLVASDAFLFIAFARDGQRLTFEIDQNLSIVLRATRPPPPELHREEVESADFLMGLTVILTRRSMLFLRPSVTRRRQSWSLLSGMICRATASRSVSAFQTRQMSTAHCAGSTGWGGRPFWF